MREVKEAANTKRPEDGRQKGVVRTQIGVLCSCVRPKGPWTIGIFVAPSNAIKSNDLGHKPDVSMQNIYSTIRNLMGKAIKSHEQREREQRAKSQSHQQQEVPKK
ncbi:uncharacterized protein LOC111066337 isoform X1 [Drosophila obscura]|uniref:uncharacterized protein LOC111066337 isoform X1 n=1 Tax=Drosophila obscura TaxID=7282 RepID=UPI001BB11578|nr:uncharacterized protein LOC111066337 isoform X1 [Drosophila obscura]